MNAEEIVLKFFHEHASRPLPDGKNEIFACRYLDEKIIDSLGIVTMVTQFEDEQGIQFSAEDMQSYEFQTIGGLVAIIARLGAPKR